MTLSNDLMTTIANIVARQEADNDDFTEAASLVRDLIDTLPAQNQHMLEASKFLTEQAIVNNEPRLMYASVACLSLSGLLSPIIEQMDGPSALMDWAEKCWQDTQTLAAQAINEMVWGSEGSPEVG